MRWDSVGSLTAIEYLLIPCTSRCFGPLDTPVFIWKEEFATTGVRPVVVEKAGQHTARAQHLCLVGTPLCLTIAKDAEQMEVRGETCVGWVKPHFLENDGQRSTTDLAQKIKQQQKSEACPLSELKFEQQSVACGCSVVLGWGSCALSPYTQDG